MKWSWLLLAWLPLLILGAALSQGAEFSHLHYAKDWSFIYAYLFAVSIALVEYLCAIAAERGLQSLGFSPALQYAIWNMFQIISNGVMLKVIFKMNLNAWHIGAYGALAVCVALAAVGDYQRE